MNLFWDLAVFMTEHAVARSIIQRSQIVSRQYDVILNRIDAPVFLAAFLCVVAFLLHVLARISSRRWGWGLVINLLLIPLPAWAVYDRALNVLAEQRPAIRYDLTE